MSAEPVNVYTEPTQALKRRSRTPNPDYREAVATTWTLAFQKVEAASPAAADLLRLCAFLSPDAIPEEIITAGAPDLGPTLQPLSDEMKLNDAIAELGKKHDKPFFLACGLVG